MTKHKSIAKMLEASNIDSDTRKKIADRIESRQIIKKLIASRAVRDLSQKDIAEKMNCTQSKISKLENGVDDDLRLGDFTDYLHALDMNLRMVVSKREQTAADEIKFHAMAIKRRLSKLVSLAHADEDVAEGVAQFIGEAFFNLVRILQGSAETMPTREDETPYIKIESIDDSCHYEYHEGQEPATLQ